MINDPGETTGANDGRDRPRRVPTSQPIRFRPMVAMAMVAALLVGACSGGGTETTATDRAPVTATADTAPAAPTTAGAATGPDSTTSSLAPAAPTTTSSTVAAVDPLQGLVVRIDEVVRFAPGGTSATIEGAAIRGERDVYRREASAGQTLEISVESLENNAVFDLFGPDGATLETEATTTSTVLPAHGAYVIVVGGTRGNASYTLTVSIPA